MSNLTVWGRLLPGLLLLVGCAGNDGTQKPDNLIPADKMTQILVQTHLAEAKVGRYALGSSDSSKIVFNRLQVQALKKFNVDTSAYRQSYIYYSSHPEKLDAIYQDVTKELEQLSASTASTATAGSATAPGSATPTNNTATPDTAKLPTSLTTVGRRLRKL